MTGLEPAASKSQTSRATNCATPRMLTQYSKKEDDCQVVAFFLREKSDFFRPDRRMKAASFFSPADETSAPKKRLSAPARSFTREVLFPHPIVKRLVAKKCARDCRCEISKKSTSPLPDREKSRRKKNASVAVDVKSRKKHATLARSRKVPSQKTRP